MLKSSDSGAWLPGRCPALFPPKQPPSVIRACRLHLLWRPHSYWEMLAGVVLTRERVGALFPLLNEVAVKQRKAQTHFTRSSKAGVSSLLSQMVIFEYRKKIPFLGADLQRNTADTGALFSFICMINKLSITFVSLGKQEINPALICSP